MSNVNKSIVTIKYETEYGTKPLDKTIVADEPLTAQYLPTLSSDEYDFVEWVHINPTGHQSSLSERMILSSDWLIPNDGNTYYVVFTAKWTKRSRVSNDGNSGENGATYTPAVSSDGVISWTNDKGLPNPTPVNIKGPQGDKGETGYCRISATIDNDILYLDQTASDGAVIKVEIDTGIVYLR